MYLSERQMDRQICGQKPVQEELKGSVISVSVISWSNVGNLDP